MRHMRHRQRRGLRSDSGVGLAALVAAVACSGLVLAQTPAQTPPGPPPPTVGLVQTGLPLQPFRAGVILVTTDVIVRNQDGVFMSGLLRDDFQVFEDGVEQEIVSLVLVHGGRVYNHMLLSPPVQEGIILPASRPANTSGRIFVLFVDDLHLTPSLTPKVRAVFTEIAETLIHEGDLFGIISTGPSSIAVDMTYDRALLSAAANRIMGDGMTVREQVTAASSGRGPAEILYRAHVAFKTARDVLLNLEQVTNRRKVFIYLSNGYDFNPFPKARMWGNLPPGARNRANSQDVLDDQFPNPEEDPFAVSLGERFAFADLAAELAELTRVANRANTSFYSFDPRGLVAGPDIGDEEVSISEWNSHLSATQNSLRVLADLTGGLAVVNRNDFGDALRQIDAETSDYYILGFYTSNPDPTVRTRRLDVQVVGREGDDLDVRARTHYSLPRGPA